MRKWEERGYTPQWVDTVLWPVRAYFPIESGAAALYQTEWSKSCRDRLETGPHQGGLKSITPVETEHDAHDRGSEVVQC